MTWNAVVNRSWRAGVVLVAGLGLAAGILTAPAAAQERVILRLKGQQGEQKQLHYRFKMGMSQEAPGTAPRQRSQEVELWVISKVLSVAGSGRMRLRQNLRRLKFSQGEGGRTFMTFDSANSSQVETARRNPGFAHLFASLATHWIVVLNSNGEVWDQEFVVPGSERDNTIKLVVSSFLQPLIDMGIYSFPKRPVGPGDKWECAPVEVPAPGGRLEGAAECEFQETRNDDNERTAIIRVKRSATYRPTPGTAARARLTQFEEGGTLAFAIERGVIKSIRLRGTSIFSIDTGGGQARMSSTNELVVREVAR